ncbi:MAG: hypothetical protein KC519_23650, partial [Anaerolineae bacterium]|nr:hypothetical protein [Anaerolineae bacterium]
MGTHIPATFLIPEWLIEFGFIDRPQPVDEFSAPLVPEDAHALLSQLHTLIENYVLLGYRVEGVVLARIESNGIQHICYFDLLQNTYLIADDLQSSEVGSWEYHTTEAVPFSGAGGVVGLYVSPFPSPNPGDGTFATPIELDINSVSESYSVEQPGWLVLIGSGNDPLHFGGVLDAVATNAYDVEGGLKTFVQANLETFVTRTDHTDTTGVGMMFILHNGNWVQETSAASFTTANILPVLVQNPDLRSTETTFEEILQKIYDTSNEQVRVSYYAQIGHIMNDVTE